MIRPAPLLAWFAASSLCFAQSNVLLIAKPSVIAAKAGSIAEAKLPMELRSGYHVNSNTPSDPYLIPLRLTWSDGPLQAAEVVFPKPSLEKYSFSEKPLSVFSGRFEVVTRFKVPPSAPLGPVTVEGKVRYQACNDRMCLAPKTVDVSLPVIIVK
jgi:DsbC/DsbD-like thiol-disulfide interchange protein